VYFLALIIENKIRTPERPIKGKIGSRPGKKVSA